MSQTFLIIVGMAAMLLVLFVFLGIWASRYAKVGPNQVLIVSGRKVHLPDGKVVGFRIVKGGGTFVFPVVEKVDVLSLEALTIEMPKSKIRKAKGGPVEADCVAQIKIKGDDTSIAAAAEHFLGKSSGDMRNIVRPLLEKHLRAKLSSLSCEEIGQNLDSLADTVQSAASIDLGNMGLGLISFKIQDLRAA